MWRLRVKPQAGGGNQAELRAAQKRVDRLYFRREEPETKITNGAAPSNCPQSIEVQVLPGNDYCPFSLTDSARCKAQKRSLNLRSSYHLASWRSA